MTQRTTFPPRLRSALIIDDEPDARSVLKKLLQLFCPQITKTAEARDSSEALQLAKQHSFDLAFVDIQLRNESGLDLAQHLIRYCPNMVFVTAHDHYAVEAYQTDAIHYLLKPVNPEHLQQAVDRAELTHTSSLNENRLLLPTRQGVVVLRHEEIIRVEGEGNYCTFFCQDRKKYFVSKHLAHYEKLLDSLPFYRIHQSHLVNIDFVRQFLIEDGYYVVLSNEDRLPVARRRKDAFLRALG